jgi:hypothetical protein
MIQYVFIVAMLIQTATGGYCATKLTQETPFIIRVMILSPCFGAIYTLMEILQNQYVAYIPDIFRAASMCCIYFFVASLFSNNPWIKFERKQ